MGDSGNSNSGNNPGGFMKSITDGLKEMYNNPIYFRGLVFIFAAVIIIGGLILGGVIKIPGFKEDDAPVKQESPPPVTSVTLEPGKKDTDEPEVLGYEIEKFECVFKPEMNKDLTLTITLEVPNEIYLNTFENLSLSITNNDGTEVLKNGRFVKTDGIEMESSGGTDKDIVFFIDGSVLKEDVDIVCNGINITFYYTQVGGTETEWTSQGFTFGDDIKTSFDDLDSFSTIQGVELEAGDVTNNLLDASFKKGYYYFKGKDGLYILGNIKVLGQELINNEVFMDIRVPVTNDLESDFCYNHSMRLIEANPELYINAKVKITKLNVGSKSYYVLEDKDTGNHLNLKKQSKTSGIFLDNKALNDETLIEEIKAQSNEEYVLHNFSDGDDCIIPRSFRMFDMRFYTHVGSSYVAVTSSHQGYGGPARMMSMGQDGRVGDATNKPTLTKQGARLRLKAGSFNENLVSNPAIGSPSKVVIRKEQYLDNGTVYRPAELQVLDENGKVMLSSMRKFIDPGYYDQVSTNRVQYNTSMFTKGTATDNTKLPSTVSHVQVGPLDEDKIAYNNAVLSICTTTTPPFSDPNQLYFIKNTKYLRMAGNGTYLSMHDSGTDSSKFKIKIIPGSTNNYAILDMSDKVIELTGKKDVYYPTTNKSNIDPTSDYAFEITKVPSSNDKYYIKAVGDGHNNMFRGKYLELMNYYNTLIPVIDKDTISGDRFEWQIIPA